MRKSFILAVMMTIGMFLSTGSNCFAADEIKVGAVQPVTGRRWWESTMFKYMLSKVIETSAAHFGVQGFS